MNSYVFSIILSIIVLVVATGSNYIKKLIGNISTLTPIASNAVLKAWAKDFIEYAAAEFKGQKGQEKMEWVIKQLSDLCKKSGIKFTDEQIRTIAQNVYDTIKDVGIIDKIESKGE